jgi:hypothetical protein
MVKASNSWQLRQLPATGVRHTAIASFAGFKPFDPVIPRKRADSEFFA